jgi:hypothetical protein
MYQNAPFRPSAFDQEYTMIAFFFGHYGSSFIPICWGMRRAKKMSVWIGKQAVYLRTLLLWRSIKRNLCRRGTGEIRFALADRCSVDLL